MDNMTRNQESLEKTAKVVDFASFKSKKKTEEEFGRGRQPLYISHLNGKVSGNEPKQTLNDGVKANFGDRLQNIRTSLDKINSLIGDLKKISKQEPTKH